MQLCEAVLTRASLVVRMEIGAATEAAYVSLVKRILGPKWRANIFWKFFFCQNQKSFWKFKEMKFCFKKC